MNARKNYGMVRQNTQNMGLISDATFNEGGLLERVAENPEGLVIFTTSLIKIMMKFCRFQN